MKNKSDKDNYYAFIFLGNFSLTSSEDEQQNNIYIDSTVEQISKLYTYFKGFGIHSERIRVLANGITLGDLLHNNILQNSFGFTDLSGEIDASGQFLKSDGSVLKTGLIGKYGLYNTENTGLIIRSNTNINRWEINVSAVLAETTRENIILYSENPLKNIQHADLNANNHINMYFSFYICDRLNYRNVLSHTGYTIIPYDAWQNPSHINNITGTELSSALTNMYIKSSIQTAHVYFDSLFAKDIIKQYKYNNFYYNIYFDNGLYSVENYKSLTNGNSINTYEVPFQQYSHVHRFRPDTTQRPFNIPIIYYIIPEYGSEWHDKTIITDNTSNIISNIYHIKPIIYQINDDIIHISAFSYLLSLPFTTYSANNLSYDGNDSLSLFSKEMNNLFTLKKTEERVYNADIQFRKTSARYWSGSIADLLNRIMLYSYYYGGIDGNSGTNNILIQNHTHNTNINWIISSSILSNYDFNQDYPATYMRLLGPKTLGNNYSWYGVYYPTGNEIGISVKYMSYIMIFILNLLYLFGIRI
jgi:hypothetical protein